MKKIIVLLLLIFLPICIGYATPIPTNERAISKILPILDTLRLLFDHDTPPEFDRLLKEKVGSDIINRRYASPEDAEKNYIVDSPKIKSSILYEIKCVDRYFRYRYLLEKQRGPHLGSQKTDVPSIKTPRYSHFGHTTYNKVYDNIDIFEKNIDGELINQCLDFNLNIKVNDCIFDLKPAINQSIINAEQKHFGVLNEIEKGCEVTLPIQYKIEFELKSDSISNNINTLSITLKDKKQQENKFVYKNSDTEICYDYEFQLYPVHISDRVWSVDNNQIKAKFNILFRTVLSVESEKIKTMSQKDIFLYKSNAGCVIEEIAFAFSITFHQSGVIINYTIDPIRDPKEIALILKQKGTLLDKEKIKKVLEILRKHNYIMEDGV